MISFKSALAVSSMIFCIVLLLQYSNSSIDENGLPTQKVSSKSAVVDDKIEIEDDDISSSFPSSQAKEDRKLDLSETVESYNKTEESIFIDEMLEEEKVIQTMLTETRSTPRNLTKEQVEEEYLLSEPLDIAIPPVSFENSSFSDEDIEFNEKLNSDGNLALNLVKNTELQSSSDDEESFVVGEVEDTHILPNDINYPPVAVDNNDNNRALKEDDLSFLLETN